MYHIWTTLVGTLILWALLLVTRIILGIPVVIHNDSSVFDFSGIVQQNQTTNKITNIDSDDINKYILKDEEGARKASQHSSINSGPMETPRYSLELVMISITITSY